MISATNFILLVCLSVSLFSCSQQDSDSINSIEDAQNIRIAVMEGSTSEQIAISQFPDAEILSFANRFDVVTALITDKTKAAIFAEPEAILVKKINPNLKILPTKLNFEDAAIAVSKENENLLNDLNDIISRLKSEGFFTAKEEKWFNSENPDHSNPDYEIDENYDPLRIGVSADSEPFCFIGDEQKFIGFEIDFAYKIGQELKRPVVFRNMFFGSLLAALKSDKIDMIISNMTPTEERKEKVNFTQPYFQQSQIMMVKSGETTIIAQNENLTSSDVTKKPKKNSFLSNFSQSFHSNIIKENRYLLIWSGLKTTVIISIFSAILGSILGAAVCFFRMSKVAFIRNMAKIYISLLRGTPVLVLLMIIFYIVFASVNISAVIVAIIAFGLNFAAYVSEMFRTGIEGVKKGQIEAGIALGFSRIRTFFYIVLPQAIKTILPVFKGELISMVKMTSVVGYIAVQDLTKASDLIRSRTFDAFFPLIMITVLYFIISWGLLLSLGHLEKISDPKSRRNKKNQLRSA
jgi:His/Glu/Gln/Arg/opine family amino acid ABC transporter permease subunit